MTRGDVPLDVVKQLEAEILRLDEWTFTPVNFVGDALKAGAEAVLRQIMSNFSIHLWEKHSGVEIAVCVLEDVWAHGDLETLALASSYGAEERGLLVAELRRVADLLDSNDMGGAAQ